ncbi:hypothetical protein ACWESJ_12575 [Staphylococcus xylosus]|uniref:hypothetical protein n=1 Tax=Staphylococcus shinii TaxID=2912228 RepID=UPI003F55E0D5
MEIKEILEIINLIVRWISISFIPLFGIVISKFRGRERIMNQNTEKWGRWIGNIFFFIFIAFIIDIVLLVSIMELFINNNISLKEVNLHNEKIRQLLIIFTIFSVLYAFFLMPLWTKDKKYFEVELEHVKGKKKLYIVLNRRKTMGKDVLFYRDKNDYKEYEEDIDEIKQREGRVTFIPRKKSIFNINKEHIEESKNIPIWFRWVIFIFIAIASLFGIWHGIEMIWGIWSSDLGSSLIGFKIVVSSFPCVIFTYFIILLFFLYKNWFGKNRLTYEKRKH